MSIKLVKLNFGSNTAHFGQIGIGLEETSERIHSDTLFSAWISNYARLFDDVESLLNDFPGHKEATAKTPPFRLSSTFIYHTENGKTTYYLPKPLKLPRGYPIGDDLEFAKAYKKLKYLPLEVWRKWYQGDGFTDEHEEQLIAYQEDKNTSGYLGQVGTFNYSKTFNIYRNPKVAIDRLTHATNIYYTGFVQFVFVSESQQSGLYFLIEFLEENTELENKLRASLNLLGDEGIGGERSSGAGRFKAKWLELPKEWQEVISFSQEDHYSLISLFWECPLSSELQNSLVSYNLIERGGWVCSPFSGHQVRRKKVTMFGEGSVLNNAPNGQLADLTPDIFKTNKLHNIYRSGIAFSLPIKLNPQG